MSLPTTYEAREYEDNIYKLWEESGLFIADPNSKKPHYSISIPPPNETGTLHVGHALFIALQDTLSRHARAKGMDVLWLPGTDHAALPTNALIEKALADEGTNKHEVGREEFLRRTREYVGNSRDTINKQIRKLGASVDWTRSRYTLDDALNRCVNEVFVKMYNDGLIYRGYRIVNWDPNLETNVSDDEVEYKEEKTTLYTLRFGPFEISTARPETKFADKYVVMHPDDERYKQYKHGDTFKAEWINGEVTGTVIKDEAIDPAFGTGVMTITPWHSLVDFEIANRYNLDKVQVIDLKGKLLDIAGEFAGIDINIARPKIIEKLESKGLLVNADNKYLHNVAINSRGKGTIEPQIRLQWFIDVNKQVVEWKGKNQSFKEVLQDVIRSKDIKLIPANYEKIYFHWIDNLKDWCISRQIWWGHRIPVWYQKDQEDINNPYVATLPPEDEQIWVQDPDTLDTWFSSALWTWSTLIDQDLAKDYSLSLQDLLDKSPDYQAYHPTNVLETGWDILFFWVARMILATTYITKEIPFKEVYLHGLVRTEGGKKMSKSDKSTIIDPLEVIPEFGTDSLRLALIQGMSAGKDQRLGKNKIITNRNFCNKLWNVARYIDGVDNDTSISTDIDVRSLEDNWILNKLNETKDKVTNDLDNYRFSDAYESVYHFLWDDLADWYIEASKAEPNKNLLTYILKNYLIILHPIAPFISEVIWDNLKLGEGLLAGQTYEELLNPDGKKSKDFEEIKLIVSDIRYLVTNLKISKPKILFSKSDLIKDNIGVISKLTKASKVEEAEKGSGLMLTSPKSDVWLDVELNVAKEYLATLKDKVTKEEALIKGYESRLGNAGYLANAPDSIVQETKDQLAKSQELLITLNNEIGAFNNI